MTGVPEASNGPWLTIEEAAAYAAVPATELLGAVGRGEIPAVTSLPTSLGAWMVRSRAVEVWAESRERLLAG